MTKIALSGSAITLAAIGSMVVDYQLNDFLGDDVALEVAFTQKSTVISPSNVVMTLNWRDTTNGDLIYSVSGTLTDDVDDFAGILNAAHATGYFDHFDLTIDDAQFVSDVVTCDAWNELHSLGRAIVSITLPIDDPLPNTDTVYQSLVMAEPSPSYIFTAFTGDATVFSQLLRAAQKLNIPLLVELDPTLTKAQAIAVASGLSAKDHRVIIVMNPTKSRSDNSASLSAPKIYRYAFGTLLGLALMRNANTNARGIPNIKQFIAGYDYPMPWRDIEMRKDFPWEADEQAQNDLADAKINVIARERFDTGVRFVLSDVLTQYDEKNSVLNLANSAEISMYIDNTLSQIAKRHLLMDKETFKSDVSREAAEFLDACASAGTGLLVAADDLGGRFYTFDITDRPTRPHDAVNMKCGYRPVGTIRAVYLETSVHK